MPAHSVKLLFTNGVCTYVTPRMARQLENGKHVSVLSREPYVLKLKEEAQEVTRWSYKSDGQEMNGAVLMRNLPRL